MTTLPHPLIPRSSLARRFITRTCVLIALLSTLFCPSPADARYAGVCPQRPPNPKIMLVPLWGVPVVDLNQPLLAIDALGRQTARRTSSAATFSAGLTVSRLVLNTSWRVQSLAIPNQRPAVCSWIDSLEVTVGFPETSVYVARELPQASCGHRAVLEHEGKHVQTNALLALNWQPRIIAYFQQTLGSLGVVYTETQEQASLAMRQTLDAAATALSQTLQAEVDQAQSLIDSPAEYQRISAQCNGEIGRLLGNVLKGKR